MTVNEDTRVWVIDRNWIKSAIGHKCRRMLFNPRRTCGKETHYGFLRSNGYWYYCPEHMFGRRITSSGQVEIEVFVGSPAAERGYSEFRG